MKKNHNAFFLLGLVSIILIVIYLSRWVLFFHFDPVYWENAYYESQWNVPNSSRQVSDETVYRYVGYRLVNNGENPFNVDYWVPPLGKYTYGITAKFFANPYITSLFYYLASVFVFYLITKCIFKSPYNWLITYLFAANPMIVNEIQTTMLDLPLTFYFLLFIYFFIRFLSLNKNSFLYLSAISLGLMAGIKPPFFIPMFAIIAGFFLLKRDKFKKIPLFFIFILVGYVISYFCYFIKHPNPIPWIRLHEKVVNFHKNSGGSGDWLNVLRYIFTREYRGYWVNAKSYWFPNWSLILPIGVSSTFFAVIQFFRRKELPKWLIFLMFIVVFYISMNFIIDFWPRYLVPMVPLLILISSYFFRKYKFINVLIFISYFFFLYLIFFPKPNDFIESFKNIYQKGFYKDTYQQLSLQTKKEINLSEWKDFSETNIFSEQQFKPVKEKNQWRISVDSNFL